MENLKRGLRYLIYLSVYGSILIGGLVYAENLQRMVVRTFEPLIFFLFTLLYYIFFGVILGIPRLLEKRRAPGNWTIDWVKAIAIIPVTLYLALTPFLMFIIPLQYWPSFFINSSTVLDLTAFAARITLGYFLVDIFDKRQISQNASL